MINVSDNICSQNQKTDFILNNLLTKTRAVYEIMYKNMVQSKRPQVTIYYGACWITKAANTHSEYVIFFYFPKQQCLCQGASKLRLYVNCLSC